MEPTRADRAAKDRPSLARQEPHRVFQDKRRPDRVQPELVDHRLWRDMAQGLFRLGPINLQRAGGDEDQIERTIQRAKCLFHTGLIRHVQPVTAARQPGHSHAACGQGGCQGGADTAT